MPTVRRILSHVSAEIAGGTRRCRRNRSHQISRGTPCLVIQDSGTPYSRSYCPLCALTILKQCGAELRNIRDVLYGDMSQPAMESNRPATAAQTAVAGNPMASAETKGELLVQKNKNAKAIRKIVLNPAKSAKQPLKPTEPPGLRVPKIVRTA